MQKNLEIPTREEVAVALAIALEFTQVNSGYEKPNIIDNLRPHNELEGFDSVTDHEVQFMVSQSLPIEIMTPIFIEGINALSFAQACDKLFSMVTTRSNK